MGVQVAESVYRDLMNQGVTITSGVEGQHKKTSLHYLGYAVDLRTRFDDRSDQWGEAVRKRIVSALRISLGDEFDIYLHSTHIHLEYQPKR